MKSKAYIIAVLVIGGSWLAVQLTQNHFRSRRMSMRHKEILFMIKEIEKIKESINSNIDESISTKDLLNVIEINRLEGQLGNLRMKNFIDLSKGPENSVLEFILIILMVTISMKIGLIEKKLNVGYKSIE